IHSRLPNLNFSPASCCGWKKATYGPRPPLKFPRPAAATSCIDDFGPAAEVSATASAKPSPASLEQCGASKQTRSFFTGLMTMAAWRDGWITGQSQNRTKRKTSPDFALNAERQDERLPTW